MCIGIIWNNSFLVGGCTRAEARIDPRPLRTSRSTAHGAQVVWPLDYMRRVTVQHCLLRQLSFIHWFTGDGTEQRSQFTHSALMECVHCFCRIFPICVSRHLVLSSNVLSLLSIVSRRTHIALFKSDNTCCKPNRNEISSVVPTTKTRHRASTSTR